MVICDKCETYNEKGSVFCAACGFQLSSSNQADFLKDEVEIKKERNKSLAISPKFQSKQVIHDEKILPANFPFTNYLIILIGGFSIIVGFTSLFDRFPSLPPMPRMPTIPSLPPLTGSIFIPLGLTILAAIIVFLVARDSSRDPVIFWIIEVLILTIGLSTLIPESSTILIPIGMTISGLLIVFLFSRRSDRPSGVYAGLYIAVLVAGTVLLIPSSSNIIIPLGFILIGFSLFAWGIRFRPETPSGTL
ncbi:MAG: hypothetical protein ACFFFG_11555 [Candidatus Thorarchaeota archaeon]